MATTFAMGDQVRLHGLQSATGRMLNGTPGRVLRRVKHRYQVEVDDGTECLVKPENLARSERAEVDPADVLGVHDADVRVLHEFLGGVEGEVVYLQGRKLAALKKSSRPPQCA